MKLIIEHKSHIVYSYAGLVFFLCFMVNYFIFTIYGVNFLYPFHDSLKQGNIQTLMKEEKFKPFNEVKTFACSIFSFCLFGSK